MPDTEQEVKEFLESGLDYEVYKLLKYRGKSDWQGFIDFALTHRKYLAWAFSFFEEIPDNLKYDFCVDAYTSHGDSVPVVRKAVRNALKYGKPDLPEEFKNAEYIVVYRAGEEPINKAKYRISWTTDKAIALFFLNTYALRHATHLYRGKIKPCHVIAYTQDRNESEIMQYNHVYDIEEITADE